MSKELNELKINLLLFQDFVFFFQDLYHFFKQQALLLMPSAR